MGSIPIPGSLMKNTETAQSCQFRYSQGEFDIRPRKLRACRLGLEDGECTAARQEECGRQALPGHVNVGRGRIVRREGANALGRSKEEFELPQNLRVKKKK
ncbi:MAG: hypothetical protein KatS3mg087_1233 [Patescibacteria group bacterium]|nr:MAG: hypothetical protein KatS3mg087_1233 [Patescibacteria group bacterium]